MIETKIKIWVGKPEPFLVLMTSNLLNEPSFSVALISTQQFLLCKVSKN